MFEKKSIIGYLNSLLTPITNFHHTTLRITLRQPKIQNLLKHTHKLALHTSRDNSDVYLETLSFQGDRVGILPTCSPLQVY